MARPFFSNVSAERSELEVAARKRDMEHLRSFRVKKSDQLTGKNSVCEAVSRDWDACLIPNRTKVIPEGIPAETETVVHSECLLNCLERKKGVREHIEWLRM